MGDIITDILGTSRGRRSLALELLLLGLSLVVLRWGDPREI
jgi:hypothetical protein